MNSSGIIYSTFPLSSRHSDRTGNDMPRCPPPKTAHSKRIQKNIARRNHCRDSQTTMNKINVFIEDLSVLGNNAPAIYIPTEEDWIMIKNLLKVSALVLVLGVASGCASQSAVDEAAATANAAASEAAAAKSAAEAARASADAAGQAAASAQSTADQALSAATESQACCDANRDRMEKMFQKSMSK